MENDQGKTRVCSVCKMHKPLASFLLETASHMKKYGTICKSCRAKQKRKFLQAGDDDGSGGKGKRQRLDYNAKLFAREKQEEKQEKKESEKQEARDKDESSEEEITEEKTEKETKKRKDRLFDKADKSRASKTADYLSRLISEGKVSLSNDTDQTGLGAVARKNFESIMWLTSVGSIATASPLWTKQLAEWMVCNGAVAAFSLNSLRQLNMAYGGKIIAPYLMLENAETESQTNSLADFTQKTFESGKRS